MAELNLIGALPILARPGGDPRDRPSFGSAFTAFVEGSQTRQEFNLRNRQLDIQAKSLELRKSKFDAMQELTQRTLNDELTDLPKLRDYFSTVTSLASSGRVAEALNVIPPATQSQKGRLAVQSVRDNLENSLAAEQVKAFNTSLQREEASTESRYREMEAQTQVFRRDYPDIPSWMRAQAQVADTLAAGRGKRAVEVFGAKSASVGALDKSAQQTFTGEPIPNLEDLRKVETALAKAREDGSEPLIKILTQHRNDILDVLEGRQVDLGPIKDETTNRGSNSDLFERVLSRFPE